MTPANAPFVHGRPPCSPTAAPVYGSKTSRNRNEGKK